MKKKNLLNKPVEHIDIKSINTVKMINAMFRTGSGLCRRYLRQNAQRKELRNYTYYRRVNLRRRLYAGIC